MSCKPALPNEEESMKRTHLKCSNTIFDVLCNIKHNGMSEKMEQDKK